MTMDRHPTERAHTKLDGHGAEIIAITDPDDPRIAEYRAVRERDLTGRDHFVAEGEVVLRVLLGSPLCQPISLMIVEKRLEGLLTRLGGLATGIVVYSVDQAVIDSVVGFPIHRGILALGRRRATPTPAGLLERLGPNGLVVVLFGIANHDNVGGIFRNAAAFGADAVLLDTTCCDPLYRKAIRVSVGGSLVVPFARFDPGEDPVTVLERHGVELIALAPGGDEPLARLRCKGRVAILLGSEGPGLPATILRRSRTVTIPMAGGFDSLNVATTSGIVLHHLTRAS